MMSKNLFFRRMKQDLEQRIWLPVLYFIISFLTLEIPLISQIERWATRKDYLSRMSEFLMNDFFSVNNPFTIFTIFVATVCAFSGFDYLHSAKKLDVYHSIPVKRDVLFRQQYIYNTLYFVLPLLVHVLICVVISFTNGVGNIALIGQTFCFMLVELLVFLTTFSAVTATTMLCGNLVISALGSVIILFYSMMLGTLKAYLMDKFFMTYYYYSNGVGDSLAFSPMHLVIKLVEDVGGTQWDYLNYMDYWGDYAKLLLCILFYTAAAFLLYKKRPTETAGSTLVFPVTEPVIKTLVVIPVSFFCGYLFVSIISARNDGFGWFVFGCVCGFLLGCPVMEVIYRRDVKAVFKHPLQLVFNGACVIIALVVLRYDLLGYDSYVPAESRVESVALQFSDMQTVHNTSRGSYREYQYENMNITDNAGTRKLLEHGAEFTRPLRMEELTFDEGELNTSNVTVVYKLKNGKEVYRNYMINIADAEVLKWMGETVDSQEYKLAAYPVLTEDWNEGCIGVILEYAYGEEQIALTPEQMKAFTEAYRADLTNMKFDEILSSPYVAKLTFAGKRKENNDFQIVMYESAARDVPAVAEVVSTKPLEYTQFMNYDVEEYGYRIYPSFTRTLTLLEEYGSGIADEVPPENLLYITVTSYREEFADEKAAVSTEATVEYNPVDAESIAKMQEIMDNYVLNHMRSELYAERHMENGYNILIRYTRNNETFHEGAGFIEGQIPEFVLEDIAKKVEELAVK